MSQGKYCYPCTKPGCLECADKDAEIGSVKCVNCDKGFFLSSQTELCQKCQSGCLDCRDGGSGNHVCNVCEPGYYLSSTDGQCKQCMNGCGKCKEDKSKSEGHECIECSEGFRLDQNKCQDCSAETNTLNCGVCDDNNVCIECGHGFYLDKSLSPP